MSRKCADCVNYNECRVIYLKWYSWIGKRPDMTKRDASYCARYMTLDELISQYEKENEMDNDNKNIDNLSVYESIIKAKSVIGRHNHIVVSISGGSDSDIVIDLVEKIKGNKDVRYVWFDTGLEYTATKTHLEMLEEKYNVQIERIKAKKPIPTCCAEIGQPFISKRVSDYCERLQRHGFKWEDKPFSELISEYPKCKAALRWWCNEFGNADGKTSQFNISRNKWLKEFMVENPPQFKISDKCCYYAKKAVIKDYINGNSSFDLNVYGVRRAEGGARATAYKTCYSINVDGVDEYRPIFYNSNDDKIYYESFFNIVHSDCYIRYGLKRTGCAGCPFGEYFEKELNIIQRYEPRLYKACNKIFGDSYAYTRKYKEYCRAKKENNNGL